MVDGLIRIRYSSNMVHNKTIRIISLSLLVIWMTVIFVMSAQPASDSSKTSGELVSKVIDVIYSDFESFSTEKQLTVTYNVTFIVRKVAHFFEFFVLGLFSAMAAFTFKRGSTWFKAFASALFGVVYAVVDEVHQIFVPGRACRIFDMCIDSIGCICAVVTVAIIIVVIKRKSGELNA